MVLVDDRSRYTWAYFLENKWVALGCFKDWMVKLEGEGRSLRQWRGLHQ
jgi:hypothetical protein